MDLNTAAMLAEDSALCDPGNIHLLVLGLVTVTAIMAILELYRRDRK